MNDDLCPREAEVMRACASGDWPTGLEQHAAGCAACRDVRAVTMLLRGAVEAENDDPLPDASAIWWRARLLARQEARQRALRPIDALERSEPVIALVAIVSVLVLRGDALVSRVFSWAAADGTAQTLQAVVPPALLPVLFVGFALCGLVILVGLGAVIAND